MNQRRSLLSLYLFYAVFFIGQGYTMYASRYYGAIGLDNTQIGLITAVPAVVAIFALPCWGMISDRSPKMKYVIAAGMLAACLCAVCADMIGSRFAILLAVLTLLNTMLLHVVPVGNAIAIEYTGRVGRPFGPIRMAGTIGYQLSILAAGVFLSEKLEGFYRIYALILMGGALCAMLLPPVRGHQHQGKKVSPAVFLRNKNMMLMLALVFMAQLVGQFYNAFFTKYMGDIGLGNSLTGVITTLAVAMEIPFLMFGDKLYKKMSIFKWMWLGLLLSGVRFAALSYARSPVMILLTQLPSVALFGCFEFFPAIYLGRIVDKELIGSAQSVYQTVAFGFSRILGASLGGMLAQAMGIGMVFRMGGFMLLLAAAATFVPLCLKKKD